MKKSITIILCVAMVLSVIACIPFSASAQEVDTAGTGTSKTSAEAVAWARSQNGYSLDYDGAYGAQCVDLIMYYYQYLGVSSPGGNAVDYTWNALPSGWTRTSSPSEGDIVVWGAGAYMGNGWYSNNPYGHIGIVTSVSESTMSFCNQNLNGQYVEECWNYPVANAATYIHPNFASAYVDNTAPVITNARAENVSASSFDIKCDLSDDVGVTRVWFVIYGPSGEKQYGVSASNGAFSHTIYTADHGGAGEYAVGFYAFDAAEHGTKAMVEPIYAINDTSAPVISNPRAENASANSFDVKCELSDNVGVTRVWLNIYGPNGSTNGYAVSTSNGTFSHTIKTSDYAGAGVYAVHIYAFDATGNETTSAVRAYAYDNPTATLEKGNQKYELFSNKMTWKHAKEICESRGGHLAFIETSEENQMLTNLSNGLSSYVWIGASDEAREGYWYWTNGDMFTFSNWYPGEPNNTDGAEHYLQLIVSGAAKGQWNDAANNSSTVSGFICEYEPEEKPILGDADGNGDVEIVDATIIQRKLSNLTVPYPEETLMNADVDGDNELTILDVTYIQRYIAHIAIPYAIGEAIT